jgi:hypothetical protein
VLRFCIFLGLGPTSIYLAGSGLFGLVVDSECSVFLWLSLSMRNDIDEGFMI